MILIFFDTILALCSSGIEIIKRICFIADTDEREEVNPFIFTTGAWVRSWSITGEKILKAMAKF